jgi:hypothetical protein
VNNIRTILPKSTREAAHSPPRHRTKIPVPSPLSIEAESNMSSSLPHSQSITSSSPPKSIPEPAASTVENVKPPASSEKTNPKLIKQRSLSTKTIYQSNTGLTTSRSSEQTDSAELNPNSKQRMLIHALLLPTM